MRVDIERNANRRVTKPFADNLRVNTIAQELRGMGVAEVMKAEVRNVCTLDGRLPRLTDTQRSLSGGIREDERGINPAYPGVLLHERKSL